ncbi:MAG: hypothetical protein ACRD5B_11810 [Nitrososphaeraceae archaeon]|jgi:hypothetical protein
MSMVRNNVMLSSFQVVCVLFVIAFLIVVYSERFVNAQVTITPGTDDEPEPVQQSSSGSGKIFQVLDYAHFIPLTNSPGNQIKLGLDYSVLDPSFVGQPMSGIMEVFAANNNSLIRTSSLSDPVIANQSGSLEFATTFTDENLDAVRTEATFTGPNEMRPVSDRISINLTLGQVIER